MMGVLRPLHLTVLALRTSKQSEPERWRKLPRRGK